MSVLAEIFELFFLQARIVFMRLLAYRVDFVLSIVVSLGFSVMGPLFQFLLYRNSRGYPGWSWDEILVFQAVLLLVGGLSETLFGAVRGQMENMTANGEFDRLLIKPRRPLLLIMTAGFSPSGLGGFLVGLVLTAWAAIHAGLPGGVLGVALFLVFIVVRVVFQAAVQILYCFFTLRWVYPMRLGEIFDKVLAWGNNPLEIFPQALRMVFCTVVPFAVAAYWPAKALLGPVSWLALTSVAGVGLFLLVVLMLWKRQLAKYSSAGG
jgi:ABC-2 type transport system permease protein